MIQDKYICNKGFTLIEIFAVLVIVGVLVAIVVPKFINSQEQANLKVLETTFFTASSNVIVSFSSFLLQHGEKPHKITGGDSSNYSKPQYWIGSEGKSTPLKRDLDGFFIRYDYNPPSYKSKIRIQILATGPNSEWLSKINRNPDRTKWLSFP